VLGVELLQTRRLAARVQPLEGELVDCLEVEEAASLGSPQQALLEQRPEPVEVRLADMLRRLQIEAAREDGEARGELRVPR